MTDKICTISNHIDRSPEELRELLDAVESTGYAVEGPKSNDSMGVSGSDHNQYYWVVREA